MAVSLANQYYLKALESYSYDFQETLENLSYALGYDDEHPGVLCLLGRLYMEQLKDYLEAEDYFAKALASRPDYAETYRYYSLLLIQLNEMERAKKLIKHAFKVKGTDLCMAHHTKAIYYEALGKYGKATQELEKALRWSLNEDSFGYLESEMKRVKKKKNSGKEKNNSAKGKGRKNREDLPF